LLHELIDYDTICNFRLKNNNRLVGKQKQVIEATSHLFLHFNLYLNKHTHRNKLKHNKDSIAVIITQKQSKKDAQSRKDIKTR
jgi:hypothetical protein